MSAKKATLITLAMLVSIIAVATGIGASSVAQTAVTKDGYGISAHYGDMTMSDSTSK